MYIVLCTVYCVQCTSCNVLCIMYCIQCTAYNVLRTVCCVQCAAYSVVRTLCYVQCATYSVLCTVCCIQSAECQGTWNIQILSIFVVVIFKFFKRFLRFFEPKNFNILYFNDRLTRFGNRDQTHFQGFHVFLNTIFQGSEPFSRFQGLWSTLH